MNEHNEAVEAFLRVFDERMESAPPTGEERRSGLERRQGESFEAVMRAAVHDVRARRTRGPVRSRDFAYWATPATTDR